MIMPDELPARLALESDGFLPFLVPGCFAVTFPWDLGRVCALSLGPLDDTALGSGLPGGADHPVRTPTLTNAGSPDRIPVEQRTSQCPAAAACDVAIGHFLLATKQSAKHLEGLCAGTEFC